MDKKYFLVYISLFFRWHYTKNLKLEQYIVVNQNEIRNMNIRQSYELKLLLDDGNFSIKEVAETFSLNIRTIQYDIQALNDYISDNDCKNGITVKNKIAYLNEDVKDRLCNILEKTMNDFLY